MVMTSETSDEKLIDWLPSGLEELTLRGYEKGTNPLFDKQVIEVVENRHERLKKLTLLEGVDEFIPNEEDLEDEEAYYARFGHQEL